MSRRLLTLAAFLVVFVGLVAIGCGGATETATVADAPTSAEIDVTTLPTVIDAQTVRDIQDRDDVVVFDVREQWEYDEAHIPGVVHIPMGDIPDRISEIPQDKTVILTCRSGNRSGQVTNFLQQNGFDNVHNMDGGILAWQAAGFPVD